MNSFLKMFINGQIPGDFSIGVQRSETPGSGESQVLVRIVHIESKRGCFAAATHSELMQEGERVLVDRVHEAIQEIKGQIYA